MIIVLLLLIPFLLALTILIISWYLSSKSWEYSNWEAVVFPSGVVAILFGVFAFIAVPVAIVNNSTASRNSAQIWYTESVENLNATRNYILTITDDYAKSAAVTNYNLSVKNFKYTIKNEKAELANPWISWFNCSIYNEFDENIVDYIK